MKIPSWKSFYYLRGRALGRRIRRCVVNRTVSSIVAVSQELADGLIAEGLAREKIVVLPNGVDLEGSAAPVVALRDLKAEIMGSRPVRVVLFVGRLVPEKAIDRLLRVWASLPKGAHALVIVGDGPLRGELEESAARLGIHDSVYFVGHRPDARRYYEIADVFVLPSDTEGLSNALLEAMAAALPVVASDVGGNRDVVTPGTGILTDWTNVTACAALLEALLPSEERRRGLGEAARERARAFAIDEIARRYIELYRRLLSQRGPVGG
jgi:glycosyltransferase involved in cell wall biosynthesis